METRQIEEETLDIFQEWILFSLRMKAKSALKAPRFMCLCLKKIFRYRKVIAWFAAELMSRPEEEKIVNSETIFVFYWTLTLINLKASFDARSSLHSLMKKVFVLFLFVLRYIFNHYSDTFTEILLYFVSVWQLAKIALLPCLIDQCGCQAQTHQWTFQVLQHLF